MFIIKDVSKFYSKHEVLKKINLKIEKGQMLGLLGKNGSGKSTLMRLLAQKDVYNNGDILFHGKSLKSSKLKLNPHLVYVSEDQTLPTHQPLSEWLKTFQALNSDYNLEVWNRLSKALDLDTSKNFYQLSRGQKMKTWLALQAPNTPQVYILDEITSVLDSGSRTSTMRFLKEECQRGATAIISTNIASELQGFASHIGILSDKELVLHSQVSDLSNIFTKIKGEIALKIKGTKPVHLNSDGSWSYLIENKQMELNDIISSAIDRRGVTIEDVSTYYSMRTE